MLSRMRFVFVVALTIAALLVGTAQVNAALALVASWALNESSGATTALDGTGSHNGSVGSSVTTGVAGGMFGGTCYNFAGGSFPADAVTVAEADEGLTGMTSMTMSVWVKETNMSGGDQLIMGVWTGSGSNPYSYGLLVASSTYLDSHVYPGGTNVECLVNGAFFERGEPMEPADRHVAIRGSGNPLFEWSFNRHHDIQSHLCNHRHHK